MSPRDFLEDGQQNISSPNMGMTDSSPRDFLTENEEPQESLGSAAVMAIPRILTDAGKGIYHAAQSIPDYMRAAGTQVPGLLSALYQHPVRLAMQGLAGVNEGINSLAQAPLNLSQYGANRLNLFPQSVPNAISKVTPEDTTQSIYQLFGEPQYPGEALLRGIGRNIPEIYGGAKLASALKPASLLTTKSSIKNTILNQHDALENRATDAFGKVSEEVNTRGINKIPFNSNVVPIDGITSPKTFFNDLRDYFPKTKQASSLINSASTGDYNSLRKLQTDLYQNAKKNLGSSTEADRMKGSEMMEKRNDINQTISNHLRNTGNNDLDDLLTQARGDWSTLQKTYYNENMNNALVKMVDKQYRKIPKNLIDILGEDSIPMQNLRDFHPGLQDKVSGYARGQNALGKVLKYGLPAAIGAAGGAGAVYSLKH